VIEAPLLEVRNLKTYFHGEEGLSRAVDGVDLALPRGRTLCIVGESGCGKSVTALTIMGLVPQPPGQIAAGEILFEGKNLLAFSREAMNALRGDRIAMIFQEPMTSLNPVQTAGDQIIEGILLHRAMGRAEARARALEMLRLVRIPSPETRLDEYPHQLSGGMRQRVMIAMALACDPKILIADEPTTALDVTIQAQILALIDKMRQELGSAVILITHDLGVVAGMADEVAVMYAGRIVEQAPTEELFARPSHPYTLGLLESIPRLDTKREHLHPIPGRPPDLVHVGPGCPFAPRCRMVIDRCQREYPEFRDISPVHKAACWVVDSSS
jgi:oligopeptide/dipeptide ABC transporter ATP-binding protein